MTPTVALVILVEMALAGLVWTAFVIHYHVTTHRRWAATRYGRNVMALAVCLTLLVDLTLVSYLVGARDWIVWAALILWPTLAVVGIDRHRLLWRDQHSDREE